MKTVTDDAWRSRQLGARPFDVSAGEWSRVDTAPPVKIPAPDPVNHPSHYADGWSNGAEVIDITENLNFNRGNAVKYLARAGAKDPQALIQDLRKAAWYVQREIERVERLQEQERVESL